MLRIYAHGRHSRHTIHLSTSSSGRECRCDRGKWLAQVKLRRRTRTRQNPSVPGVSRPERIFMFFLSNMYGENINNNTHLLSHALRPKSARNRTMVNITLPVSVGCVRVRVECELLLASWSGVIVQLCVRWPDVARVLIERLPNRVRTMRMRLCTCEIVRKMR